MFFCLYCLHIQTIHIPNVHCIHITMHPSVCSAFGLTRWPLLQSFLKEQLGTYAIFFLFLQRVKWEFDTSNFLESLPVARQPVSPEMKSGTQNPCKPTCCFYTFVHWFNKQEIKCFRGAGREILFPFCTAPDSGRRALCPDFSSDCREGQIRLRNSSCGVGPTLPLCPVSKWAEAKKQAPPNSQRGVVIVLVHSGCCGLSTLWAKRGKPQPVFCFSSGQEGVCVFLPHGQRSFYARVKTSLRKRWHQTFPQSIGCFLVFLHVGVRANFPCSSCCLIFCTPSPHTAFTMVSALMTHLYFLNAVGPPPHTTTAAFQQQDVHLSGVKIFFFFFPLSWLTF